MLLLSTEKLLCSPVVNLYSRMSGTPTVPDSLLLRHSGFVLAKLRRSVEAWDADDDELRLLKIACLAFVANAHLLTREIVATQATLTSTALLQRTLWHNAGQLAWLLNGPRDLADRLDVFRADHDTRAASSILDRPISMFGHSVARSFLSVEEDLEAAKNLRAQAELAEHRVKAAGLKKWSQISVSELRKAMRQTFAVAKTDFGQDVEAILRQSEDAVASGDDMAHPNAFAMLSLLNLVDMEALQIQRPLNVVSVDVPKVLYGTGNLLIIHSVAIYAHKKALFPLKELLEALGRSLIRWSGS